MYFTGIKLSFQKPMCSEIIFHSKMLKAMREILFSLLGNALNLGTKNSDDRIGNMVFLICSFDCLSNSPVMCLMM